MKIVYNLGARYNGIFRSLHVGFIDIQEYAVHQQTFNMALLNGIV